MSMYDFVRELGAEPAYGCNLGAKHPFAPERGIPMTVGTRFTPSTVTPYDYSVDEYVLLGESKISFRDFYIVSDKAIEAYVDAVCNIVGTQVTPMHKKLMSIIDGHPSFVTEYKTDVMPTKEEKAVTLVPKNETIKSLGGLEAVVKLMESILPEFGVKPIASTEEGILGVYYFDKFYDVEPDESESYASLFKSILGWCLKTFRNQNKEVITPYPTHDMSISGGMVALPDEKCFFSHIYSESYKDGKWSHKSDSFAPTAQSRQLLSLYNEQPRDFSNLPEPYKKFILNNTLFRYASTPIYGSMIAEVVAPGIFSFEQVESVVVVLLHEFHDLYMSSNED